ncbi:MAG: exopolyphosphatase, partial [Betaproteobacteria bacterium]|nr:exopolyphosphatase [Betaproteobacteria bacterium]
TVRQFMRRYHVDTAQAQRVAELAQRLYSHLRDAEADAHAEQMLAWAAALHEIGISIAHNGYHKHGAYILNFADMPGFSKKDQARLAVLVLGHRGKLEKVGGLPPGDGNWLLILSLRLATLFHRTRADLERPPYRLKLGDKAERRSVLLELPAEWLAENPLTAAAFAEEVQAWQTGGLDFRLKQRRRADWLTDTQAA